jgi:4-amino-4-deoxy-L-arabinose transferase-like glycosyltransferase
LIDAKTDSEVAGAQPGRDSIERRQIAQESRFVGLVAALLGIVVFAYCARHNLLLLYGDAVAHLHISRRVFDSLNPGFRQLGSVWLPLPHLLMIPFVMHMDWWQSGLAGAIPSIGCYTLGCIGIYRLARIWLSAGPAAVAVAFYGLNPGLLYMQTTAMTEPLFLAEMIWATLFIAQFCRAMKTPAEQPPEGTSDKTLNQPAKETNESINDKRAARLLLGAGLVLLAAVFTRYDGWIFASFAWLVAAVGMWRSKRWRGRVGGAFVLFTVMLAVAPLLWMAYNAKQFGDPLDFLRGPYSAKAIEERTRPPGSGHHPGWHSMRVAALYFLKAAELGAVPLRFANALLLLAILGTAAAVARWWSVSLAAMLLLWLPVPFYAYSIAYGSVPIFIPLWWPHSWYNTRYGMELLPAFALFVAMLLAWLLDESGTRLPAASPWILSAVLLLIVIDSAALTRATPLVLQEAIANSRSRIQFEQALARTLFPLSVRTSGPILMYTSEHIGALQRAGIPLKRTINEGDYYQWPGALHDPAASASLVVAIDDDAVAKAVREHPKGLDLNTVICSTDQQCARIYFSQEWRAYGSPR